MSFILPTLPPESEFSRLDTTAKLVGFTCAAGLILRFIVLYRRKCDVDPTANEIAEFTFELANNYKGPTFIVTDDFADSLITKYFQEKNIAANNTNTSR